MKLFYSILTMVLLLSAASALGAALGVSPTNIDREVWSGQGALSNQVVIWNTNGTDAMVFTNTVSYTNCGVYSNWLTVTPATGTSYGEYQGVWVQMVATGLPPRTNAYEGAIRVDAGAATSSPQIVRVTLLVQGVNLWVSPTNFTKTVTEGQGTVWDTGFQVANTGAAPRGTMSYTMNSLAAWLTTSPTNGVAQYNTNQVSLGYVTAGWPAGWYTSRVDVVALGIGTQAVGVVLQINHWPELAWNAASQVWTNEAFAGGAVATTSVEVWNASPALLPVGPMNYQVSVNSAPLGWVTVNSASGVSTGNHGVVTVSYNTAGLAAGIYTGQLTATGVDQATGAAATDSPLSVGLQLTIKGTPTLMTDPASLSQTILEHYTGTSSFNIWNGASPPRGGLRYTVTADVGWVGVSPATGVLTDETNAVLVTWSGAAPGTNWGNLTVDAWDAQSGTHAAGAPALIPLQLIVTPRTPQNLELPMVIGILYVGQTVTNYTGLWQNQGRLSFSYQWERAANKAGGGGETLGGEAGSTHAITTADRGKYLRVAVTATDSAPYPISATAYSAWVDSAKVKALTADFNGDGITDLWFFDESTGTWRASFGTYDSAEGIFGGPGMTAAPGDYDGDGNEDLAVFDRSNGIWHMLYLPRGAYVQGSLFGGTSMEAAANPVPADYDGDGATDTALYWLGYWAVRYSSTMLVNVVAPFAGIYGLPVAADWDGDGIVEMGVYDNGLWSIRHGNGTVTTATFGGGNMVLPAPADYDGDGVADLGVYDTGINQWRLRLSQTGAETNVTFGVGGTVAFPGYYDHDPKADWAQAHLLTGNDFIVWEVKRTTETNFPYRGQSFQQTTGRWRVSW